MNPLLKLSVLFAIWETSKMIMGRARITEAGKDAAGACLILTFEVPYLIWGIWLVFHDVNAAIVLWGLTIASATLYFFNKDFEVKFHPVNCGLSALALAAVFMGKL